MPRASLFCSVLALALTMGCGDDGTTIIVVNGGASGSGGAASGGTQTGNGGTDSAGGSAAGDGGSTASSGGAMNGGSGGSDAAGSDASGGTAPGSGGSSGGAAGGSGGGATSGTILFFDDFEDGNKDGWADGLRDDNEPFGTWDVRSAGTSLVYHVETPSTYLSWAIGGDVNWTDVKVDVDFRFVDPAVLDDASFYVAVRFRDFANHYRMRYAAGETRLTMYAGANQTATPVLSVPVIPIGTWANLTVIAQGSNLSGYIDDVLIFSATNDWLASGGIALAARGAAEFDNVRVTVP